jgi:hypothetical protein
MDGTTRWNIAHEIVRDSDRQIRKAIVIEIGPYGHEPAAFEGFQNNPFPGTPSSISQLGRCASWRACRQNCEANKLADMEELAISCQARSKSKMNSSATGIALLFRSLGRRYSRG